MRLDVREPASPRPEYSGAFEFWQDEHFYWMVLDRDSGKNISSEELIVAADDSTGQIVKYQKKDGLALHDQPLVSEIRNIELVYMGWEGKPK